MASNLDGPFSGVAGFLLYSSQFEEDENLCIPPFVGS